MSKISYKEQPRKIDVYLEGKKVGAINEIIAAQNAGIGGWQYMPKGHDEGGEIFTRLNECKRSLSEDGSP